MIMKRIVLVLLVMGLVCGVACAQLEQFTSGEGTLTLDEKGLPLKTITSKEVTSELLEKTKMDFDKRENIIVSASVDSAKFDNGIIITSSSIVPRESGGITSELFCQDNVGHFMPIWGGSLTKDKQDWSFTLKDIQRKDIDGCYFAIVDSTKEAMLK